MLHKKFLQTFFWDTETLIENNLAVGLVVDSSVLVAVLVDSGPDGLWSERATLSEFLVAPELAIVESMNVLRRLELAGQLTVLEAASAQADLHQLKIELYPVRPFEARIWELRYSLTSYDAWYVAIAERLELPLATLDRRLAAATGPRCQILLPR